MPELPEVETLRRFFDNNVLNRKITSVSHIDSLLLKDGLHAESLVKKLTGSTIKASDRHGKYLFIITSDDRYLIIHFGMTGGLIYQKDSRCIPDRTRLLLGLGGPSLAFVNTRRLGKIFLYGDRDSFLKKRRLGPDALHIGKGELEHMISKRKRPIKSALMDQSLAAGIGNLYADEVLFQTGVHPRFLCRDLKKDTLEKMSRNIKHILKTAIEKGADISRYPDTWLLPHRNKDGRCPRCGGGIAILKIAGRTTYFCPRCQRI